MTIPQDSALVTTRRQLLAVGGATGVALSLPASALAFMLRSHVAGTNWHLTFRTQAKKLNFELRGPDGTPLVSHHRNMGFPLEWETLELWRPSV